MLQGVVVIFIVVQAVLFEEIEEYAHVFEPGVHSLAIKRDHGMGGIAKDDDRGLVVVWGTFDGYKGEMRV